MNCNDNNIDNGNCQCSGIATSNNGDAQEEDCEQTTSPVQPRDLTVCRMQAAKVFFISCFTVSRGGLCPRQRVQCSRNRLRHAFLNQDRIHTFRKGGGGGGYVEATTMQENILQYSFTRFCRVLRYSQTNSQGANKEQQATTKIYLGKKKKHHAHPPCS